MREKFILDPNIVFLNHGSFGACPREVLDTQYRWQLEMEKNPVEFLSRRSAELLFQARTSLADLLRTQPKDMVFIPNATNGVSIVAQSLALQPEDEILTTDLEYGACNAAWQRICNQKGAIYRQIKVPLPFNRDEVVNLLLSEVTAKTKLIYFSHITSSTALILPAANICAEARERGIATFIDGAHAPGQISVDLNSIDPDFYVGNCHKWLCAPKGSAFLYARTEHHSMLDATVISWGYADGVDNNEAFNAYLGSTLFEQRMQWQGTRDISAWLSVPAALDFQKQHNWPKVQAHCHELAKIALDTLIKRFSTNAIANDDDWAQMVAIPVTVKNPAVLGKRLYEESQIEIPVTYHNGQTYVRISVQGYNTLKDIEHLLAAPALRYPDID